MELTTQEQQTAFDAAYKAHQPPAIRALIDSPDLAARQTKALDVASQGYLIDYDIMVWGWDPFVVMTFRKQLGLTWDSSMFQLAVGDSRGYALPGVTPLPGQIQYDPKNPPAGSIVPISNDPADFPPYVGAEPAPAQPPPPPADYVGDPNPFVDQPTHYSVIPGDPTPDGVIVVNDLRGKFRKHKTQLTTPFGTMVNEWYEPVPQVGGQ